MGNTDDGPVDGLDVPDEGAWSFRSDNVADHFDEHVRGQLPFYPLVTRAVAHIGRNYLPEGGLMYDVGASTGNIGRALADTIRDRHVRLVAVEEAPEMAARYNAPGIVVTKAAQDMDFEPFDFAVCMLVLMFLPPREARGTLERLVANIGYGGALVVVDKTTPPAGYAGVVLQRLTWSEKLQAGARPSDIVSKELSLAGVQRPADSSMYTELGGIEWFRFGDFAGWLFTQSPAWGAMPSAAAATSNPSPARIRWASGQG